MKCQLMISDEETNETQVFPLESIRILPADCDLLFLVPAETAESDFHVMADRLDKHFRTEERRVLLARTGDITVVGFERG